MKLRIRDLVVDMDEIIAYSKMEVQMPLNVPKGAVDGPVVMKVAAVALYLRGLAQPILIQFANERERDNLYNLLVKMIPPDTIFSEENYQGGGLNVA